MNAKTPNAQQEIDGRPHSSLQAIIPNGHYLGLAVFYLFDLVILMFLFAMIFRYLPDAKIAWNDVWTGVL